MMLFCWNCPLEVNVSVRSITESWFRARLSHSWIVSCVCSQNWQKTGEVNQTSLWSQKHESLKEHDMFRGRCVQRAGWTGINGAPSLSTIANSPWCCPSVFTPAKLADKHARVTPWSLSESCRHCQTQPCCHRAVSNAEQKLLKTLCWSSLQLTHHLTPQQL